MVCFHVNRTLQSANSFPFRASGKTAASRSLVRLAPLKFHCGNLPEFSPFHPRHRDEKHVTASPLDSTVANCDARNSFRIRFYENCRASLTPFPHFSTTRCKSLNCNVLSFPVARVCRCAFRYASRLLWRIPCFAPPMVLSRLLCDNGSTPIVLELRLT